MGREHAGVEATSDVAAIKEVSVGVGISIIDVAGKSIASVVVDSEGMVVYSSSQSSSIGIDIEVTGDEDERAASPSSQEVKDGSTLD